MKHEITLVAVVVVVALSGCATMTVAHERRETVRTHNATDVEGYRSTEALRGATWGMTSKELRALKNEPEHRSNRVMLYTDSVDGSPVPTTYAFFDDHLAQVKSRFDPSLIDVTQLEAVLQTQYGAPLDQADEALKWDIAMSVLANSATAGSYPMSWGFGVSSPEAVAKTLERNTKPKREVVFASPETRVHLIVLESGLTEISYTSRRIGPRFVQAQLTEAGVAQVSDEL